MSIENLKNAVPEFAKDLKLNLGSIARTTALNEEQLWGSLLASAAATRNATVLAEISDEAADNLSAEAYQAALGAASIMGMNNVFYRGRHFLDGAYDDLRPGLRMNIIGNPGSTRPTSSCGASRSRRSTAARPASALTSRSSGMLASAARRCWRHSRSPRSWPAWPRRSSPDRPCPRVRPKDRCWRGSTRRAAPAGPG